MSGDGSIPLTSISSLGDRRRIAELEEANAELRERLAESADPDRPAMSIERAGCAHYGETQVRENEESITCVGCGAELNPYEVLRRIAHREVMFCYTLARLREEAEQLNEEVKRLKATRSRMRREAGAKP